MYTNYIWSHSINGMVHSRVKKSSIDIERKKRDMWKDIIKLKELLVMNSIHITQEKAPKTLIPISYAN